MFPVWAINPPIVVDCERIVQGFLAQPVNAVTSLSFVIAGSLIAWQRPDRRLFGLLVGLVGAGSFLFHGPMPFQSEWLHDVTIGWVLAAVALDRKRQWLYLVIPIVAVTFAVWPSGADPIMVLMAAVVVAGEATRGLRQRVVAAPASVGVLVLGAGIGTMSRTGWPWCDPDSLIQGHAVWHLLAATALFVWGTYSGGEQARADAGLDSAR